MVPKLLTDYRKAEVWSQCEALTNSAVEATSKQRLSELQLAIDELSRKVAILEAHETAVLIKEQISQRWL